MKRSNYHIVKKITFLFILFLSIWMNESRAQNIYGFSDNMFCSVNIYENTKDTLITFSGEPWINLGFRSAIDRYNGRYFFGGSIPEHSGNFHIIDLVDLSIESHFISPENIEYDFIKNRLVYEKNGVLFSLDLMTMQLSNLGVIENGNSFIYGQTRTYVPQTNEYFYTDYIYDPLGSPYFLLIDADSGEISCQVIMEEVNNVFYSPGGLVTNNYTGEIIGHRNGRFGIVNPCNGTMTKLSDIPDYWAHLNNQMAVYNHNDNTYIVPYVSTDTNDKYKIAIIDVYNNEVLETMSQPWNGKINLHQIYDKPVAPLIYLNDTLFVPQGNNYNWYMDDEWIAETTVNYWVPTSNGTYRAEVEFREYTTPSTETEVMLTSADEIESQANINIYPIPTPGNLFIEMDPASSARIQIVDITGKVVQDNTFENKANIQLNITDFPKGTYSIIINTDNFSDTRLITKY